MNKFTRLLCLTLHALAALCMLSTAVILVAGLVLSWPPDLAIAVTVLGPMAAVFLELPAMVLADSIE